MPGRIIAGRDRFRCAGARGRHGGAAGYNARLVGRNLFIFTALRYEAAALARSLPRGTATELHVVGMKCASLPRDLDPGRCRGIVMAGLGGALDPALKVGDVVVDEQSDLQVPDGAWRRGGIFTAAEVVSTPADKAALFRQTGALVVDLENDLARRLAAEWGVPFLGVRAVSDRAGETLEPAVARLIDPAGRLRPARLAVELCRRPALAGDLWRLRAQSGRAMAGLVCALRRILAPTVQPA
jgi:hypothetical protein